MAGIGMRAVAHPYPGLTAVLLLALAPIAAASEPWAEITVRPEDLVGTLSCSGTSCHGSPHARLTAGTVSQQEFVYWLGGSGKFQDGRRHYDPRAQLAKPSGDPHARAAWSMLQPRFQEVLRRASVKADGSLDAEVESRCARCHDPLATRYSVLGSQYSMPGSEASAQHQHLTEHGIGCESCHGGARRWLAVHYDRDISREQLRDLGLIDTKNLLVRARVCSACHVGSAENDMNHDMLAAGHPPLRFEQASYEALLSGKHWDDRHRRVTESDYEFQLWASGRVAAAEASLKLLESRAKQNPSEDQQPSIVSKLPKPWPEFAEMNCFACHQELKPPGAQPVEKPAWRAWDVSLANIVLPRPHKSIEPLTNVRSSFANSLLPDAVQVVHAVAKAREALVEDLRVSESGIVLDHAGSPLAMHAVLRSIADVKEAASWDDACHQLAALAAIRRSLIDRGVDRRSLLEERFARVAAALQLPREEAAQNKSDESRRKMLQADVANIAKTLLEIESRTESTIVREASP